MRPSGQLSRQPFLRDGPLAALERKKIEEEHKEVQKAIKDYQDILARPERVL